MGKMAHISIHCADCVRQLGEDFIYVHEWLDAFAGEMGPKHRDERHHVDGVEEVRKKWGDQAAQAAEIHIKRDCSNRIPTMKEIAMWKLFS